SATASTFTRYRAATPWDSGAPSPRNQARSPTCALGSRASALRSWLVRVRRQSGHLTSWRRGCLGAERGLGGVVGGGGEVGREFCEGDVLWCSEGGQRREKGQLAAVECESPWDQQRRFLGRRLVPPVPRGDIRIARNLVGECLGVRIAGEHRQAV